MRNLRLINIKNLGISKSFHATALYLAPVAVSDTLIYLACKVYDLITCIIIVFFIITAFEILFPTIIYITATVTMGTVILPGTANIEIPGIIILVTFTFNTAFS